MLLLWQKFKNLFTPKNPLKTAIFLYAFVLVVYAVFFNGQDIVADSSRWGEFGDFLGGFINPLIGLITIWLLTVSLKQNESMLKQSQEELDLTRQELRHGQQIQIATKDSLKQQIEISKTSTDLASAKVMLDHFRERSDFLRSFSETRSQADSFSEKVFYLNGFLEKEFSHIVARNIDRNIPPKKSWILRNFIYKKISYTINIDTQKKKTKIEVAISFFDETKIYRLIYDPVSSINFHLIDFFQEIDFIFKEAESAVNRLIDYNIDRDGRDWELHLFLDLKQDTDLE